jgi:hypothetical protein
VIAALVAAAAPTPAEAQLALGARLGYAFALGKVGGTLATSDWIEGQVPVQLDVLYAATPRIAVGGYVSYGFGRLGGDAAAACEAEGGDCSASVVRAGAQGIWTFRPVGRVVPWAGVGFGYEWARVAGGGAEVAFHGFEYLNLQAGGDFQVARRLRVGPWLMLAVGEYGRAKVGDVDRGLLSTKTHAWVGLGLRGRFDL